MESIFSWNLSFEVFVPKIYPVKTTAVIQISIYFQVEQLQKRIDFSHKDNLTDRESSLRVRDEYLKTMQERLHRQETENMEERSRLQGLIAKLEMQLREQSRQLEQDRWKITQDENRVKSLQVKASFCLVARGLLRLIKLGNSF